MIRCVFCDFGARDLKVLSRHLMKEHGETATLGGVVLDTEVGGNELRCWCGEYCTKRMDRTGTKQTFHAHLRSAGGLEAHLLEIALGGGQ